MTDGRALPGVELRLESDGQIVTRGPDCCLGYTDQSLTASAFDADGWYYTGDVGVLDDEGYLSITDRISDIIIRGGENISAQEVEDLLLRMESVVDVAVVAEPDARLGEHAAAVVSVREWPESVHEVRDFPRTPSGKIQKFRLRQQLREGWAAAGSP